ncbi:MAG: ShlB/FhaC/HecB family hemolysin secretion/activation protein [Verrucomicrobiae bacterium]|nr:ShlB/FhaC/HecB family hemolysin secretion/activation protein [Verrucomicrobiae bacterium]
MQRLPKYFRMLVTLSAGLIFLSAHAQEKPDPEKASSLEKQAIRNIQEPSSNGGGNRLVWVMDEEGVYRQVPESQVKAVEERARAAARSGIKSRRQLEQTARIEKLPFEPSSKDQARAKDQPVVVEMLAPYQWIRDAKGGFVQVPTTEVEYRVREEQKAMLAKREREQDPFGEIASAKRGKFVVEDDRAAPRKISDADRLAAQKQQSERDKVQGQVLVQQLRGIVFVNNPKDVEKSGRPEARGISSSGVNLVNDRDFKPVADEYLNKPISLKSLGELSKDVVGYYRQKGYPVVYVFVPEQDITSGVVQVVVVEARVGQVQVKGNKWFSDRQIASQVRLKPGEIVNSKVMDRDLDALNNNPFRKVDAVYSPGKEPGTTDITLQTKDRIPFRPFVGYENSGNEVTSADRLIAGFNWGDAFFLDHQLNYQYTTDPSFKFVQAHSASYLIPLPWRHRFSVFGGYSESVADVPPPVSLKGDGYQVGFRYTAPLPRTRMYDHEVSGGLDFKSSNNNLEFGGLQVYKNPLDIFNLVAEYRGTLTDEYGVTSFNPVLTYSPGGVTKDNSAAAFQNARANAKPDYVYGQFNLNRLTRLPYEMSLYNRFTYQVATGNLTGSEQIGIGGLGSVRGYDGRYINGDDGVVASTEFRSPSWSFGKWFGWTGYDDQFQVLGFLDYGWAELDNPLPGERKDIDIMGIGPGLRYQINTYLTLRADYGVQLLNGNRDGNGYSRWNFGVTLSY